MGHSEKSNGAALLSSSLSIERGRCTTIWIYGWKKLVIVSTLSESFYGSQNETVEKIANLAISGEELRIQLANRP